MASDGMAKRMAHQSKLAAFLRLTRAEHSLMLAVAVIAAELETLSTLGVPAPSAYVVALSLITPIAISMASFAINDYFDVEADRANGFLDRPLVSGALGRRTALYTTLIGMVIGVAASALINAYALLIALVFAVLAVLYSARLKRMLLVGNVYIALSMVIAFVYGDFVVSGTLAQNIVVISLVIFLSGLAREIHGMMRDSDGDVKARRVRGVVQYMGMRTSAFVAFALYAEAVAISIFAFFEYAPFMYNPYYLVPIAVADVLLMYVALGFITKRSRGFYLLARNMSLGAMSLALLAYLIAPLTYAAAHLL